MVMRENGIGKTGEVIGLETVFLTFFYDQKNFRLHVLRLVFNTFVIFCICLLFFFLSVASHFFMASFGSFLQIFILSTRIFRSFFFWNLFFLLAFPTHSRSTVVGLGVGLHAVGSGVGLSVAALLQIQAACAKWLELTWDLEDDVISPVERLTNETKHTTVFIG